MIRMADDRRLTALTDTPKPAPTGPSDDAVLLRAYAFGRDVPCPACGYNLRNTDSPRCPECGGDLHLAVGTLDLPLGPFTVRLLAAALPLGFWGTFALFGLLGTRRSAWWQAGDWTAFAILCGMSLLCGVLTGVAHARRRSFLRLPRRTQWKRAAAWVACLTAAHVVALIVLMDILSR